jgi:hypothetical protein
MAKFKKGSSGNPKGRPKGTSDKRTELRGLLQPRAHELVDKAVELALAGDTSALKLCIDRVIPAYKPKDESVPLPSMSEGANATDKSQAVIASMAKGEISPADVSAIIQAITGSLKVMEIEELEERLKALEEKLIK